MTEIGTITYVVTGTLVNGRRFAPIRTANLFHALGINLYNGSVWAETAAGKRVLIRRVWN